MRSAGPRGVEELEFVVAPDEFSGGVFEDVGEVGFEVRSDALTCLRLRAGTLAHRRTPVDFR